MSAGPQPSWRKPAGMFLILLLITVWAVIVASLSPWIGQLPALLQAIIYVFAGIVWILPLKPLLAWMETGRWRP
jgi:predicted membrane channel-forming protein YqfA (hemolysin III family)